MAEEPTWYFCGVLPSGTDPLSQLGHLGPTLSRDFIEFPVLKPILFFHRFSPLTLFLQG